VGGPNPDLKARARRARDLSAVYAVLGAVAILIGLQFLLLMVGMEAYLGGRPALLVPSALGSALCFAASCWIIRYIEVLGPKS